MKTKVLKRDEIPKALIKSFQKKFSSPVIDLKKDYNRTESNRIYKAQATVEDKSINYEVVIEERYADIVAIVEVVKTIDEL